MAINSKITEIHEGVPLVAYGGGWLKFVGDSRCRQQRCGGWNLLVVAVGSLATSFRLTDSRQVTTRKHQRRRRLVVVGYDRVKAEGLPPLAVVVLFAGEVRNE